MHKGLKPGMLVTSVNGVHLRGKSRHAVKRLLLGIEGSVVTLAYNSGKFHSSESREVSQFCCRTQYRGTFTINSSSEEGRRLGGLAVAEEMMLHNTQTQDFDDSDYF